MRAGACDEIDVPAKQRRIRGGSALGRHVLEFQVLAHRERLHRNLLLRVRPARGIGQPWIFLCIVNKFTDVFPGSVGAHGERADIERVLHQHPEARCGVGQLHEQWAHGDRTGRGRQKRVAVGLLARQQAVGDRGAAPALVLHGDRHAEYLLDSLRQRARRNVGRTAGSERHVHRDRLIGEGGCACAGRGPDCEAGKRCGAGRRDSGAMANGIFHVDVWFGSCRVSPLGVFVRSRHEDIATVTNARDDGAQQQDGRDDEKAR